jgi:hypothetical protein
MEDNTVTETGKDNPVESKQEKKITVSECKKRCREVIDNRVYPAFRTKAENNQKTIKKLTTGILLLSGALVIVLLTLMLILLNDKKGVKKC